MSLQILTFCCRNALQHYRKATFVFVEWGGGGGYFMDINAIRIFLYIIKKLTLRTIDILKNIDDNIKNLMNKNIILVTLQNS